MLELGTMAQMLARWPNCRRINCIPLHTDGEVVDSQTTCEECNDKAANFRCDQCNDYFCSVCFWRCHLNGNRTAHTVTKTVISPLCCQCERTRATLYCEQCQELLCSECFSNLHVKGNRQLHLFTDATNLLLLLERLDAGFQDHMRRAIPRVLWAISQLQAWTRGIEARTHFRKRRDLVTKIQRRWRGALTRRKLLGMLEHYKWRRKQVNEFFLPRTRQERAMLRARFQQQLAGKQVTASAAKNVLTDLKHTILDTAAANPLESLARTKQTMAEEHLDDAAGFSLTGGARRGNQASNLQAGVRLPIFGEWKAGGHVGEQFGAGDAEKDKVRAAQDLATSHLRDHKDVSLRELLELTIALMPPPWQTPVIRRTKTTPKMRSKQQSLHVHGGATSTVTARVRR